MTSGKTDWTALWAKTGPEGAWHPLFAHIADAAAMGRWLWQRWLTPGAREALSNGLCLTMDEAESLSVWLCASHDIGKATPAFQAKRAREVQYRGMLEPPELPSAEARKLPHGLASGLILQSYLRQVHGFDRDSAAGIGAVLASHHGQTPEDGWTRLGNRYPGLIGWSGAHKEDWRAWQDEACRWAEVAAKVDSTRIERLSSIKLPQSIAWVLAGLVVLADWIASTEACFPYIGDTYSSNPSEYLKKANTCAESAADTLQWSLPTVPPSMPESGTDWLNWLQQRFGFAPRGLQELAVTEGRQLAGPALVVVEAPMGEGKTEAAFALAELFAARCGFTGAFVALPTRATANQMYRRVTKWRDEDTKAIILAHGTASRDLRGMDSGGLAPAAVGLDDAQPDGALVAASWFARGKRRLLAPVGVGTIDQILVAGAKVRHGMLRMLGLCGKVLIIDEAHAFDAYMNVFLLRVLAWLGRLGVPVIVLSATLPNATRSAFVRAYRGEAGFDSADGATEQEEPAYPRMLIATTTDTRVVPISSTAKQQRVALEFLVEEDTDDWNERLCRRLEELTQEGGNVLVVRNTVRRAQETRVALEASGKFRPEELSLVHSRYVAVERRALDEQLVARFGPGGERPERHIVVATQVAEQSLDVDFDLVVSDLAPVDLLLQRMGRGHRHVLPRPEPLSEPRLIVAGVLEKQSSGLPGLPRGSQAVYGKHLLWRTWLVLQKHTSIQVPEDLAGLVEWVYGEADLGPPEAQEELERARLDFVDQVKRLRAGAERMALPEPAPDPKHTLAGLLTLGGVDVKDDDDHELAIYVRAGERGVEVLLVHPAGDHGVVCSDGTRISLAPDAAIPSPELRDRLLEQRLVLPASLPYREVAAACAASPGSWERDPWLRKVRVLVVPLRPDFVEIDGRRLSYSKKFGLEVA